MMARHVMGIDCGLTGMGYAVAMDGKLVISGALRTESSAKKRKLRVADDDLQRVQFLVRGLNELLTQYAPAAVFVEMPTAGAKGARANRGMGLSTGLLVAVLEMHAMPTSYLIPSDVRKILCGKASAGKDEAAEVAIKHYGGPWPEVKAEREHAVDAAAVLLASVNDPLYRMASHG